MFLRLDNFLSVWKDKFKYLQPLYSSYIQTQVQLELEVTEKNKLKSDLDNLLLQFNELTETNNNLVSATWREREKVKATIRQLENSISELSNSMLELNSTKKLVEEQHHKISESINYARKIQIAINPTEREISNELKNSFILYKPKHIISGDFPYYLRIGDFTYLAVVDCTGHGVPGAMMAMIGKLLLNDILNKGKVQNPSEVLFHLHMLVNENLKQFDPELNLNCGMDIALCRINRRTNEILYSGAHRPLLLCRNNMLVELKGDKFPIGGIQYKGKNKYTDQELTIEKGDSIFIFTDGFPDQIGGAEAKKLTTSKFKELALIASTKESSEMKAFFEQELALWQQNHHQVDDILLIGTRF